MKTLTEMMHMQRGTTTAGPAIVSVTINEVDPDWAALSVNSIAGYAGGRIKDKTTLEIQCSVSGAVNWEVRG